MANRNSRRRHQLSRQRDIVEPKPLEGRTLTIGDFFPDKRTQDLWTTMMMPGERWSVVKDTLVIDGISHCLPIGIGVPKKGA